MQNPPKARQITRKVWIKWIIPVVLTVWITVMTWFPRWIEEVYSMKISPYIAMAQRAVSGWVPFSIGDILYLLLVAWLVMKIVTTIRDTYRRKITRQKTWQRSYRIIRFAMWVYIIFNLAWGWNYHRQGLDHQLQLPVGTYSSPEIKVLLDEAVARLNENRLLLSQDTILPERSFRELSRESVSTFERAAARFHFLRYRHPSIKKTVFDGFAPYMGFTGYYNPFTGEAQLRTSWPEVLKPFILCHEIGHQVGYAKEFEASFASYLAASSSNDPYFRYSVYLELYSSLRSRYRLLRYMEKDTTGLTQALRSYNQQLDTLVRFDRRKISEYLFRSQTYFSEQMSSVVMTVYEQYLFANAQSRGLKSYDDVVSLLVAYRRKYGKI